MSTLAIHLGNNTNLGDQVCSPCSYFDYDATFFSVAPNKHVRHEPRTLPDANTYIFGGGAITKMVRRFVDRETLTGPKVAWGIGLSAKDTNYPTETILDGFDLVGSRDVGIANTEWVPCATCMSPLFDQEYEIEHDVVVYLNSQQLEHTFHPHVSSNRVSFEEAIRFIGAGKVVVTNSYHGAYWATLLGRTAVIANAYSSKFYQYKHQPVVSPHRKGIAGLPDIVNINKEVIRDADTIFPEALEECREANVRFNDKVQTLFA